MKYSNTIKKILVYSILIAIILFNFHLYRGEFKVLSDPNDNIFQYALVDEAGKLLKQIFTGKISPLYLFDNFNERWAEGFPLSLYYSHIPQAVISLISQIGQIEPFKLFVIIRTLILVVLPLMFFLGARVLGFSGFLGLLVAFFSQTIITDGLYGIDATSFIWRGWGLSSQLLAVFFMPLAFAYSLRYLGDLGVLGSLGKKRDEWILAKAVFFNFLVAQAHIGIFLLLVLSYPLYLVGDIGDFRRLWKRAKRLIILLGLVFFSLSYFIVPFFLYGQYRNFSLWDPIWKFDSWGIKQIIIWFLGGALFDFGRLPLLTLAVIFGGFWGIGGEREDCKERFKTVPYISLLFWFYLILFFGRAGLGKLIDFIPGFSEYHLHRIILMVQFFGIFLAAWFVWEIIQFCRERFKTVPYGVVLGIFGILGILGVYTMEQPVIKYASDNNIWIERANKAYMQDLPYYNKIKESLGSPKARVYVGRPGNWGRNFLVGETPLYMALSRDGFSTIGFLPESWSPNSDPEQFFSEDNLDFYNLYNVGYAVFPDAIKPPSFAKLIKKEGKYNLYKIPNDGWFEFVKSSHKILAKKTDLLNITRLWFESSLFKQNDIPTIDLGGNSIISRKYLLNMQDLNHYTFEFGKFDSKKIRNIWQENPFIVEPLEQKITWQKQHEEVLVNGYKVRFNLQKDCKDCLVILKETYHPNWQVWVNGQKTDVVTVMPFYVGIPVEKAGNYEVVSQYYPNELKVLLIFGEIGLFGGFGIWKLLSLGRRLFGKIYLWFDGRGRSRKN